MLPACKEGKRNSNPVVIEVEEMQAYRCIKAAVAEHIDSMHLELESFSKTFFAIDGCLLGQRGLKTRLLQSISKGITQELENNNWDKIFRSRTSRASVSMIYSPFLTGENNLEIRCQN